MGCPTCQPHDWLLRQPVCAALRDFGRRAVALRSIWGETQKWLSMVFYLPSAILRLCP